MRLGDDVPQRVGAVVPGAVGNQQGPLVRHRDEPGDVAAGRDLGPAVGAGGAEHAERREGDEAPAVPVEVVEDLLLRPLARLAVDRAQLGLAGDGHDRISRAAAWPSGAPRSDRPARRRAPSLHDPERRGDHRGRGASPRPRARRLNRSGLPQLRGPVDIGATPTTGRVPLSSATSPRMPNRSSTNAPRGV